MVRWDTTSATNAAGLRNLVVEGDLVPTASSSLCSAADLLDTAGLVTLLTSHKDAVSSYLWNIFSKADQTTLLSQTATLAQKQGLLVIDLNAVIQGISSIYTTQRFTGITLSTHTPPLLTQPPPYL